MAKPDTDLTPEDLYWKKSFQMFPTWSEFKSQGMLLASPEKDLKVIERLDTLAEFKDFASYARTKRDDLAEALKWYNQHRGDHAQLSFEDALWGRVTESTRMFGIEHAKPGPGVCIGGHLAPAADLLDHNAKPNALFECDPDDNLVMKAKQPIKKGEELTIVYKRQPKALLEFYGILDEPKDHSFHENPNFTPEQCSAFRAAHLEQHDGPLLQNIQRFVDIHCPAPKLATPVASGAAEVANTAAQPDVDKANGDKLPTPLAGEVVRSLRMQSVRGTHLPANIKSISLDQTVAK